MVVRYKAIISYDGSEFEGYQIQNNKRTVQGELQKTLSLINNCEIKVVSSGRTDAKVHALQQVIHFDSIINIKIKKYIYALNRLLPKDIHVLSMVVVDDSFHARFSVVKKHYRYVLNIGKYDVFKRNYQYEFNTYLDLEKMQNAANLFVGKHDFANFCSTKEDETDTYIRTIESFTITKCDDLLYFDVIGDGFLRYMVRMMVGCLIKIGENKIDEKEIKLRLDSTYDNKISYKAPGHGLYLVEVFY